MLDVQNACLKINQKLILDKVSFTLNPGKRLAVLGPSGSGKTSLLRLILGLDAPSSGIIKWNNQVFTNSAQIIIPTEHRNFGCLFQEPILFSHLSVIENVAFGLWKLPKKTRYELAAEWLSRIGLAGFEKRSIHNLSGGERQRITLARILAVSPRLILLDEPFSSVDRPTRENLITIMNELFNKEQIATILVTHDAHDAFELADDLLLIRSGMVEYYGELAAVYNKATKPWVTEFMGSGFKKCS